MPGECRTSVLPARGGAAAQVRYRSHGVQHAVRDEALEYVEGGSHVYTDVQGPGVSESSMERPEEPDPRVMALALVLLASMVGAFAAFICAAGTALWWLRPRKANRRAP